jgi:hypothetical protein
VRCRAGPRDGRSAGRGAFGSARGRRGSGPGGPRAARTRRGKEAIRARATTGDALKVSEAGERYLAERTRDAKAALSKQTAAQNEATFRLFAEFTEDAPLGAITRRDASEFLDTLAKLHRHYGRRRGAAELSLDKLLKKDPAAEGEGLSNKTLNRHLSAPGCIAGLGAGATCPTIA